jgi:hypothetical protein
MRRALPWVAMPLMLLAIVLLLFHLRRPEDPPGGSRVPPPETGPEAPREHDLGVVPETMDHACPACGACTHEVRVARERRLVFVESPPGGFRLWGGKGDPVYFEDPAFFAAAASRRDLNAGRGSWELRVEYRPRGGPRALPHPCVRAPRGLSLTYELVISEEPIPEERVRVAPELEIFASREWMSCLRERPGGKSTALHFGWRLRGAPVLDQGPCGCGIP